MPLQQRRQTSDRILSQWILWALRLLGFCIFVWAFFLPAIRAGSGTSAIVFDGWKCASIAATETVALFGKSAGGAPSFEVLLVAISGWINPLVPLLLLLSFARSLLVVRRVLAVLVLLCIAATWTFFALQKATPLIGHMLWIAGALLVAVSASVNRSVPGPAKAAGGRVVNEP
ncbi:MAG TPA: hypothetical protein VGG26_02830 [Terracidiphilus sp.]|jgi:hypothetical protein